MKVLDAYPFVPDAFSVIRETKGGREVECDCPLRNHDQSRLYLGLGEHGQLLIHCFACGKAANNDILRAVGLKWADCFPEGTKIERIHQECVAKYHYRDAMGRLLYMTLRLQPGRNGRDKEFKQWRPNPHFNPSRPKSKDNPRGFPNLDGVPRVLYRLPQLLASHRERPIVVCEGEKDADSLAELGLVATTAVCGASTEWLESYSEALAGRHVVIVEDADDTGRRHANEVLGSVMRVARTTSVVRLPQKDATAFLLAKRRELEAASLFADEAELSRSLVEEFRQACERWPIYRAGQADEAWRVM